MRFLHVFLAQPTRSSLLSAALGGLAMATGMTAPSFGGIVTFGTDSNKFDMEFVTIGDAGNASDTTGQPNPAGSVGYSYGIGKYEVSEDMITKYNSNYGTANSLVITKDTRAADKPATGISWNEAARFVNWLNTSKGGFGAYKYASGSNGVNDNITPWTVSDTLDYDASNPFRSKRATYVLPSYNEWYKAAYYDPSKAGTDKYWNYATGSDTPPTAVASGTSGGTAVYGSQSGPAVVTQAGGLSHYGVMGLGGNVFEWEETATDLTNNDGSENRGRRGGNWSTTSANNSNLSSSFRDGTNPLGNGSFMGFRVAMVAPTAAVVPEPSTMVIGTILGLGGLLGRRRMKR